MSLAPRSFVARVALTTALTIVGASAAVAVISQLLADRLSRTREDATLTDAAETVALELRAPNADPHWVAADEARELAHTAMHVAIFDDQQLVAGDSSVARVPAGACHDAGTRRVCARPAGRWVAVVGRDQRRLGEQERTGWLASALAVLLTSIIGGLAAFAIARLVTRPLAQLRSAVERVPTHDPSGVDLGPPANLVEVDQLRESLRAAFLQLGAALAQSRRFASDAAHELRTPLATLIGELELAAEQLGNQASPETEHALRLAQRMSKLVDRLLILARLDVVTEREHIEVRELVEDAIDTFTEAARRRVAIESSAETDSLAVSGDRTLLVATFVNALENALKFSEAEVRVRIAAVPYGVRVSIVDEGPGIAGPERERVFGAFYRTAASRASGVPGHGLGLALIAHVVSMHGGTVGFSDAERGAMLVVQLPAAVD
jgi:signal transduction histidine kinase